MLEIAAVVALTGLAFTIIGLPFALAIREGRDGWSALVTDSAALGVVFATLSITAWSWLGITGIVLSALVFAAFVVAAVRHPAGLPPLWRPVATRDWLLVALWVAIIVVAILFRLHNANFLPWVGDMGAYVNWANEFVRTGVLSAGWPPVFSVFLSISAAWFGTAATTAGIAFTGFLFIAVVVRILRQVAVNRWVIVGIAGAMALNIHAIWYSYFPSSESLNAPIFTMWLSLLLTTINAARTRLIAVLGASFLVMLDLCLLRGSGSFILAPLLALAVLSLVIRAWRAWSPRIWLYLIACLIAASVGVWYGVTVIPRYFVDTQIGYLLPSSLFDAIKRTGLFSPSPVLIGAFLILVLIGAGGWMLARRLRRVGAPGSARSTRVLAIAAGAILVVGITLEAVVSSNIWFIFLRMGLWLVVATAATLFAVGRLRTVRPETPVLFLAVATALMLIAFHTTRVGNNRVHAFFIYWDRYLVSEVLPALLVVAGIGLGFAVEFALRWGRNRTPRLRFKPAPWMPAALVFVAVCATAIPSIPSLSLMSRDTYMSGAYSFTQRLYSHVSADEGLMWGATSPDAAPGFFFPNTWMAFAVPLERTFGCTFLNVSQKSSNFAPDDVISDQELQNALAASGKVLVFETQTGQGMPLEARVDPTVLKVTKVTEETSDISLLEQHPQLADWTHAHIDIVIWSVSAVSP